MSFLKKIRKWIVASLTPTYGSQLEAYIISHRPQNNSDIEKLTLEFDQRVSQQKII